MRQNNSYVITSNKRLAYIDVSKSICIFLMIIGHWTNNEILLTYIYSFHMPALFVISGILYKPRRWYKTIISLAVPVFFFSFVNLVLLLFIKKLPLESLLTKDTFFRFFHYRYGMETGTLFCGDWFIWALLALRFLGGDIPFLKFFSKYYIYLALIAIGYMTFESYLINVDVLFHGWFIGKMVPCMPFFCLGFYLKEASWNPTKFTIKLVVFLLILSIFIPIINGKCGILETQYGLSYILFAINAIAASLLLLSFSNCISSSCFFTVISKGTLLILGLHMPIMELLDRICPDYLDFLIPIFVLLVCYYPIVLFDRWCPLLLGKLNRL